MMPEVMTAIITGRNGVCVEDLKQFNVAGDERNQITFASPFQLSWCEAAQRTKHLAAYKGEKLEGNIVIAGLFGITEKSSQNSKDNNAAKQEIDGIAAVMVKLAAPAADLTCR